MRERKSVRADRLTGEQVTTTELPPDASFAERFAAMKASGELSMLGHGPVEQRLCGVMVLAAGPLRRWTTNGPELPPGWVTNDEGEFCPACQ